MCRWKISLCSAELKFDFTLLHVLNEFESDFPDATPCWNLHKCGNTWITARGEQPAIWSLLNQNYPHYWIALEVQGEESFLKYYFNMFSEVKVHFTSQLNDYITYDVVAWQWRSPLFPHCILTAFMHAEGIQRKQCMHVIQCKFISLITVELS